MSAVHRNKDRDGAERTDKQRKKERKKERKNKAEGMKEKQKRMQNLILMLAAQ